MLLMYRSTHTSQIKIQNWWTSTILNVLTVIMFLEASSQWWAWTHHHDTWNLRIWNRPQSCRDILWYLDIDIIICVLFATKVIIDCDSECGEIAFFGIWTMILSCVFLSYHISNKSGYWLWEEMWKYCCWLHESLDTSIGGDIYLTSDKQQITEKSIVNCLLVKL